MNSSGVTTTALPDFNFTSLVSNDATWKFTGGITKYNSNSNAIESVNPKNIYSTIVYGTSARLPIGSIANAKISESSVFTCDYNLNEVWNYWDKQNGWTRPDSTATKYATIINDADYTHFGQKCMKVVNHYGAGRPSKIINGKSYKMTAWVKVTSGRLYMVSDFRYMTGSTDEWPVASLSSSGVTRPATDYVSLSASDCNGKWVLMTLNIPASKTSQLDDSHTWCACPWIGADDNFTSKSGEGDLVAYIDDLRFGPSNAQISTTYYDTLWQQPILSVGTDNNPGKKVVYDGFGRPVKWYKVDKHNPANNTIVQKKEYHLMNDYHKPNPAKWYKIVPEANNSYCIDISGTSDAWTAGAVVHLWSYQGNTNQQWKFVQTSDGYYNIVSRVADGNGNYIYAIDDPYGNIADETVLKLYTISGDNQKWKLTDAGGGYCKISAKASDAAYIDLKDGVASDGTTVQIYTNGENTKWKLVEVE